MHWLPLVAMVIASALPFPHRRLSRVAVATSEPGSGPPSLVAPPANYSAPGDVLDVDAAVHTPGSVGGRSSSPGSPPSRTGWGILSQGRTLKSEGLSEASRPQDRSGPNSRRQSPPSVDFPSPGYHLVQPGPGSEPWDERRTAVTSGLPHPSPPPGPLLSPGLEDDNLGQEAGLDLDHIFDRDEMFLDAHPRVLFSTSASPPQHPPFLLLLESGLLEEEQEEQEQPFEGHGDRASDRTSSQLPVRRDKRSLLMDRRRGEKSVCESESIWVTDKSTAVDAHGHNVTIMREIQTQTGPLKQFFYETRCRRAELRSSDSRFRSPGTGVAKAAGTGVAGSGCLGVDKKQWVSECKAKQSFVRALTKDQNNRVGWRWIRIDSSCVCVLLARANPAEGRELHARTGRG